MSDISKLKEELAQEERLVQTRKGDLQVANSRADSIKTALKQSEAKVERLKAQIKNATPWTPKEGDQFWFVDAVNEVGSASWLNNTRTFQRLLDAGNVFPGRIEAEFEILRRKSMVKSTPKPQIGDMVWVIEWSGLLCQWVLVKLRVSLINIEKVVVAWNYGRIAVDEAAGNDWIAEYGKILTS